MFPLLLKGLGHNVWGLDIRKYPMEDLNFIQANLCSIPSVNNCYDIITAISVIEHIGLKGRYGVTTADSDEEAATEIYRVLKPKGKFLITVPYGTYKETKMHKIYNRILLHLLLQKFTYTFEEIQSPEADYQLALIEAVK
jgi:ubiquinone/menaquinone biosynthesis C-methylase UbiE